MGGRLVGWLGGWQAGWLFDYLCSLRCLLGCLCVVFASLFLSSFCLFFHYGLSFCCLFSLFLSLFCSFFQYGLSSRPPRWPVIGVPGEVPAIDQHLLKNGHIDSVVEANFSEQSLLLKRHFRILEGIQLRGWAGMYDHCTCNKRGGGGGRGGATRW